MQAPIGSYSTGGRDNRSRRLALLDKLENRHKNEIHRKAIFKPYSAFFILSVCYCYPVVENATGGLFWPSMRLFDCTVSSNLSFPVFFPLPRSGGRGVSGGCALLSRFARQPR